MDDDESVLSGLRRGFALEGYDVRVAQDGETALAIVLNEPVDLIVLDVMLPRMDGLEVCRRARAASTVPILLLTARDTVPDRVAGLDTGADDYLVKPFSLDELLARCRALLRRMNRGSDTVLKFGDLAMDNQLRQAFRGAKRLSLTPNQFDLLLVFLQHPRQALSREQLCHHVWGCSFEGESNFIDVAVMELRKKLEYGGAERLIQTLRGFGYALREG